MTEEIEGIGVGDTGAMTAVSAEIVATAVVAATAVVTVVAGVVVAAVVAGVVVAALIVLFVVEAISALAAIAIPPTSTVVPPKASKRRKFDFLLFMVILPMNQSMER